MITVGTLRKKTVLEAKEMVDGCSRRSCTCVKPSTRLGDRSRSGNWGSVGGSGVHYRRGLDRCNSLAPCGVLLWRPSVILPRLDGLLDRIQSIRGNIYPEIWDADPLYEVEQELIALLKDIKGVI